MSRPSILCISTYEKGQAFLREAAALGCDIHLLTVHKLRDADWPRDILAGLHTIPEDLTPEQTLPHIANLMRHIPIVRIVPLDEFDLETAALAREHLRLPGLGQTATRFFRDKLAMREAAARAGVPVPAFSSVANHDALWRFLSTTEGPWLLKPRWSASAIGIHKFNSADEVWPILERLGDAATNHLVERFVPGDIFHVEGITWNGNVLFAAPHKYGQPPFETMHTGGIFSTRAIDRSSADAAELLAIHAATLQALGMQAGVTHSEFIRAHADGRFYFLETAARVGGAYIAEVVEHAAGINPWIEWARIEVALARIEQYQLPPIRPDYAGSLISLARQEWPDTSAYTDPEIVHRLSKLHHAGLILRSPDPARIESLLRDYTARFLTDFYARLDAPAKPTA
ncbi:MAG TPA: ATPase [Acidobacteriaceae bacterium]|nr:ATPase [Acidobacteriaceae bacterium]